MPRSLVGEKCSTDPATAKDITAMSTWPSAYCGEVSSLVVPSGLSAGYVGTDAGPSGAGVEVVAGAGMAVVAGAGVG